MSNILNPKPRFGFNPTTGQIYDYLAQKDITPTQAAYSAADGTWNLIGVRDAILAGTNIEVHHLSVIAPKKPAPRPAVAPARPTTAAVAASQAVPARGPGEGMSTGQLTALKLQPLQAAALGITHVQMTSTGVTAAQVKNWGLTAARADALKLTAEQRAVLLPAA